MKETNTLVIGGGPAGIAVAASLRRRGVGSLVLEKGPTIAPAWHNHYDRLHLHTNKAVSGLPGRPMPASYPKYPSRDDVAAYMANYADQEGIKVHLNSEVVEASSNGRGWLVATADGQEYAGDNLVVATGLSHTPFVPTHPGQETFAGEMLHTSEYRNGEPFRGKRVLVVGFGNSAGEIAVDLADHGAQPSISVRSPSVVVPRDILGVPILAISRWLSFLPPRVADFLSKPLLWLLVGDISKYGIPRADMGPLEQIATKHKVPLLDVGTMDALKDGRLEGRPGIRAFKDGSVEFVDGSIEVFDVIVWGTGYLPAVDKVLTSTDGLVDEHGVPLVSGGATTVPTLYFCGFREPATGRLREIGIEAERIADLIAR